MSLVDRIRNAYNQFREHRREATERAEQRKILFNQLREHGNLCVSAMWYYTKEQAHEYSDIMRREAQNPHGNTAREIALMKRLFWNQEAADMLVHEEKKSCPDLSNGRITLVDLGCGDGTKASVLSDFIAYAALFYIPIDGSRHMMHLAVKNIQNSKSGDWMEGEGNFGLGRRIKAWFDSMTPDIEFRRLMDQRAYWINRVRECVEEVYKIKKEQLKPDDEMAHEATEDAFAIERSREYEEEMRRLANSKTISRKDFYDKMRLHAVREQEIIDVFVRNQHKKRFPFIDKLLDKLSFGIFGLATLPILLADYAGYAITGKFPFHALVSAYSPWYFCNTLELYCEEISEKIIKAHNSKFWKAILYGSINPFSSKTADDKMREDIGDLIHWWNFCLEKHGDFLPFDNEKNFKPNKKGKLWPFTDSYVCTNPPTADFLSPDLGGVLKLIDHQTSSVKPACYMLLGQTLGNFTPVQQGEMLRNFHKSMDIGDYLLIGVELRPVMGRVHDESIDKHVYDNDVKMIKERYEECKEFLLKSTRALGIPDDSLELKVDYIDNAIQMKFEVKQPVKVKHGFKSVELSPGQIIPVASSYKFTPDEVNILLTSNGFSIVRNPELYISGYQKIGNKTVDGRPEYMVVLARK